jgi:glycosyltransferase involved in cell wall biosynthesis
MCPSTSLRSRNYTSKEGLAIHGISSIPALVQKDLRVSPPLTIKRTIEKTIKKFNPDVLHVQTHFFISYTALTIAKEMGIATMGTNHFMPENVFHHLHLPKQFESALNKIGWRHLHYIYKKLDIITTPTEAAANLLRNSKFPKPVQAVSNGIDLKIFHPNYNTSNLRKRYNLTTKKPIILFVGRLDAEKNLDRLIKTIPKVLKQVDAQLVIAGRGLQEKKLKSLVSKLHLNKNITFTGFVPDEDLPKLYCLADCFVIPGTAELQSIATMEAMASRVPIIAADAVALPELVKNGENGYLFPPKNLKVLADCLIKILSDKKLRDKMAQKSYQIIQAHDVNKVIKKFESIYKEITKKP